MDFPFSITYTLINNILTIVFDFSKLLESDSLKEYRSLKTDYFNGGGFYINRDFHQITFADYRKQQTFVIDMTKNGDYDSDSEEIKLTFTGEKCAAHWRRGGGNSNEYPVTLTTEAGYRWAIGYHNDMIHDEQKQLDKLLARAGSFVGKRAADIMNKRERGYNQAIRGHNSAITMWRRKMAKLTTTGVTLYKL